MICYLNSYYLFFSGSATPGADALDTLFIYYLIAAVFVFLSVVGFITYILFKYRNRNREGEPPQVYGSTKVEVSLTLLATALVGFFFYLTLVTIFKTKKAAGEHCRDLVITGHQWWWEARYPQSEVTTANEIHVPVGKRILLRFKSADVIHSWWVPDFGQKMDVIPGKTNHLWLQVEKPGLYLGACSEFCGAQHAWMRIRVIAQPPEDFRRWNRQQAKPAVSIALGNSLAALGKRLFSQKTCGNCHAIKGTKNSGSVGPDLTHLASRQTLLTGKMANTPENLNRWINDPQKVKAGAHMPRFIFDQKQVNALVSY